MTQEFDFTEGSEETIRMPILPLRNSVLFPQVVIPLSVGRETSIALIKDAAESQQDIAILTQLDPEVEAPTEDDLHRIGSAAGILKIVHIAKDSYSAILRGLHRIRLVKVVQTEPYLIGEFERIEEVARTSDIELDALVMNLRSTAAEVVKLMPDLSNEATQMLDTVDDPGQLCDFIAANMDVSAEERQQLLATIDLKERLTLTIRFLTRQLEVAKVSDRIQSQIKDEIDKHQREYFLRQQYKLIKEELGEGDDGSEFEELEARVEEKAMPDDVRKVCKKQLDRLRQMQPASGEYGVVRTYLDTLLDIPWLDTTEDKIDITEARRILDEDHYGLEKVKDRLIEFLAVRKLKKDVQGSILCLVGPPGVGKTSLGQSVARAIDRKFVRISLGGVRDEAEIRGHRRTYLGALPGRIVQGLRKAETINPVMMLDEIDKVANDFRGDPQAALLEVLDPEQNNTFSDHYVEIPVDLSQVMFIANANQLDTISPPLRDRMEIIEIPGYTANEKLEIVKRFLLPRQIEKNGISVEHIVLSDESILTIIERYTREAGVRNLDRCIADVCRKIAVRVANEEIDANAPVVVNYDVLTEFLGPEKFEFESIDRVNGPGITTGLAWTPAGGDILFIEASKSKGKGELKLTGQLGDVMKESALAAISHLKMRADALGLPDDFLKETDVHIHFPAGAVPKDGPSAGIAIFTTLLSLFSDRCVRHDVAMTGEITLRGNVLPVGGIKEKTLAAHRAGIKRIILPERNRKDMYEVAQEVKDNVEFCFVSSVDQIPELALVSENEKKPKASAKKRATHTKKKTTEAQPN